MLHKLTIGISIFVLVMTGLVHATSTRAEIVIELPDRTVGANGAPEHSDPPDTSAADVFPPFKTTGGPFITGIEYRFTSTQDWMDAFNGAAKKIVAPHVEISLAKTAPESGDEYPILTQPIGFESLYFDMYFNWCLGTKDRRITQNGLVAGGQRLLLSDHGNDQSENDCYDPVTRVPASNGDVDNNDDGIGDRWALRYFGTAAIDPKDDADKDGYAITEKNGVNGPKGPITVVPDSFSILGTFATGDGVFSNAEEYIWGTNPKDPDTDDDGYADEQDVSGLGQINIKYVAPTDVIEGDSEFAEVIAVGISTFKEGEGRIDQAKVVNTGRDIFFGKGADIAARINYRIVNDLAERDPVTQENSENRSREIRVNDEVEFLAEVNNARAREGNIHYAWKFELVDGGVDAPDTPDKVLETVGPFPEEYGTTDPTIGRTGYGLNPYRLIIGIAPSGPEGTGFQKVAPKTGNKIRVTLDVTEPETGKYTTTVSEFNISLPITLDFDPPLPIVPRFPLADEQTAPEYTVSADTTGLDPQDFLFEWYIDEKKVPNNSIGGSTMTFKATKPAGDYKIQLIMYRVVDESKFADVTTMAKTSQPNVEIANCAELESKVFPPSQPITLSGYFNFGGNYPQTLAYNWYIENNITQTKELTEKTTTDTFTFIPEAEGAVNVAFEVVTVPPTGEATTQYHPYQLITACQLTVSNSELGPVARTQQLLASIVHFVPSVMLHIAEALSLFVAVVLTFIFITYKFFRRP